MATFGDCWRVVLLFAPMADPTQARTWVQWAYNRFCEHRGWSHLRAESAFATAVQKVGTCGVTVGSAVVTPGTLVFTAADVGRQFRVATVPIYTIISFQVGPGTVTLNRIYTEPTAAAAAATVLDAYVTVPEDFERFISVIDPANRWRLRHWYSQDYLNKADPTRQNSSNPRLLASLNFSPVPGSTGRARYELYPYQTGAATYPFTYFRKPENLTDDQEIIGPLARRSREILFDGAMVKCAMWPGPDTSKKNPYFSPTLALSYQQAFDTTIQQVEVKDDELYFESLTYSEFQFADFPWDSNWLQSHEPSIIG